MAKNSYTIKMEYKKALAQANQLEEIATEIMNLTDKELLGSINRIAKNWNGEASDRYQKKGQKSVNNIQKIAGQLKKTSEVIRDIAKRTYNAEMKALTLAKTREY